MHISVRIIVTLFLSYISSSTHGQSPKTFYVGHSLSDDIPDMVQSLSDDHTIVDFSWVYQSIPGAPLRWQWDRKAAMDYTATPPHIYGFYDENHGLPAGNFDVLVLTESVPRQIAYIDETYAYADSFYRYATTYNPDLRVYLYEDWHCLQSGTPTGCAYDVDSNPWRQRLEDDLAMWESVVDTLNARFHPDPPVCMIPAAQGLATLYDSIQVGAMPGLSQISDIFTDDIHLTEVGKYYIACIHFAMIHETSPVGLTHQLKNRWQNNYSAPSPALALKFQEMAWETVIRYPKSCARVTTAVDVQLESDGLTLMPNPTADVFEIQGLIGQYDIVILNSSGQVYQTLSTSDDRIELSLETLPMGLYFIKIENMLNHNIRMEKILKQH